MEKCVRWRVVVSTSFVSMSGQHKVVLVVSTSLLVWVVSTSLLVWCVLGVCLVCAWCVLVVCLLCVCCVLGVCVLGVVLGALLGVETSVLLVA